MYRIEAAASVDVGSLPSLEPTWPQAPSVGAWLDSRHIALVAVGPEGPVGGILLTPCRQMGSLVTKYRVEWLYVAPEHRHQGLGQRLTHMAAAEATRRGASTIVIPIRPSNQRGLSWSEQLPRVDGLGFVIALDRSGL